MKHLNTFERLAYGLDDTALKTSSEPGRILMMHPEALVAFEKLQALAKLEGFDMQVVSAYRAYDRQQVIWDSKAQGKRQLIGDNDQPLDYDTLNKEALLYAILKWSALPGCSRHHWGTDFDIYDANAMALADVELVASEVNEGGACYPMHCWLDKKIENNEAFGFFRPFIPGASSIAEEKWHISFAPVAQEIYSVVSEDVLLALWEESDLALLGEIRSNLTHIWDNYIRLSPDMYPKWVKRLF